MPTQWVKKQDTKLLCISPPNIDRFAALFHCYTRHEICNKKIITDPTTPQRHRYTTLWNISFQKLRRVKAQQQQPKRARTVKERDRDWWAVAKQLWRDKNLSLSTTHSTICDRKDHFLHGDLGLKCPKRRLLKNWLKQTAMRDLPAQNSCWMMLSSFDSVIKVIHISSTEKFTERPTVSICCNKE